MRPALLSIAAFCLLAAAPVSAKPYTGPTGPQATILAQDVIEIELPGPPRWTAQAQDVRRYALQPLVRSGGGMEPRIARAVLVDKNVIELRLADKLPRCAPDYAYRLVIRNIGVRGKRAANASIILSDWCVNEGY